MRHRPRSISTYGLSGRDRGLSASPIHSPVRHGILSFTFYHSFTIDGLNRSIKCKTRHRASTGMFWLTFRVRVTTAPQYGRNGTASAAGVSMLSLARGVFAGMRSAWHCVRRAVGLTDCRWTLPRITSVAIATQPVHRLQIRPCTTRVHPLPLPHVTSGSVQ